MKVYIISGLGAGREVFDNIEFQEGIEPIFLDWLIPKRNESFSHYVDRMAKDIDASESFCLIGYSFGGIVAQEIHKKIPAEKIIILGSIKSWQEKSLLMKIGKKTHFIRAVPLFFFNERFIISLRRFFGLENPKLLKYFYVKNPYYLKWSIEKILNWKSEENKDVIQILADKDAVFPVTNSKPNYIIRNATHLFPITKAKEVSKIFREIFEERTTL